MLKLWGRINSINVQKVLWALAELKVPYERTDAGLQFGVVNEPFYRRMNPNGRVPTIEDDGFVLWESNAIVRYLAAKHGAGTLWPNDLRERADADRWMDWATSTVAPAITPERRCSSPNPSSRSEEHTSELQSQSNLVCRLLLEKKKTRSCRPSR